MEKYGDAEKADNNPSLENNYFSVHLETRELLRPKKEDLFPLVFDFWSFNARTIKFNKIIIITKNDRSDVTDRLVLENRRKRSVIKNIENGIVDIAYDDDEFYSDFSITIYESTINRSIKEFYIEYDFDAEFLNGEKKNFNNTVKLTRRKWKAGLLSTGDSIVAGFLLLFLYFFGK